MKKRIIAIITASILILAAISVPFAATEFSDMKDHWAKANVENLRSKGIIDGYEDGTFKPENTVTYGEFIKMQMCIRDSIEGEFKKNVWPLYRNNS